MRLVVISGLSGAGKSVALHTLEDLGFYCTDNLPANLLPEFTRQLLRFRDGFYERAAVGIDARSPAEDLRRFPTELEQLKALGVEVDVVFLEAEDDILIKRFSETRRRHPLTVEGLSLAEAIREERLLLEHFADSANLRLDTSRTTLYQLRDLIKNRVGGTAGASLSLLFQSFGFKHGVPRDADFVFDLRCLPNPYWEPRLRQLTGRQQPVVDFLEAEPMVAQMEGDIEAFIRRWLGRFESGNRAYLTVALGCTGGQHRSVYMAERLAAALQAERGPAVLVRHRELAEVPDQAW
ncbi:MAG: RNase adapter RapZ [Gammaproteobacteria bacterium]|nr:RNase adapter RapZ [Gammaproteobacteria bacterium]